MRIEQVAFNRGYRVTEEGVLLNPRGVRVGVPSSEGYITTQIRVDKRRVQFRCHRLQAYQKYGEMLYEEGIVTRHLDGDRENNSWENIAIGTQSDNMMDIPEQVRIKRAIHASSFNKKYNESEVIDFYNECRSYKKTMEKFKITSKGTLHYILNK